MVRTLGSALIANFETSLGSTDYNNTLARSRFQRLQHAAYPQAGYLPDTSLRCGDLQCYIRDTAVVAVLETATLSIYPDFVLT